jgi:hypothetical protein
MGTEIKDKGLHTNSEQWFDYLIATLKAHQVMLETDTANEEIKQFYNMIMGGNSDEISFQSKMLSQRYFISKIIWEYLALIKDRKPSKLAFDYNDSEVLVWAEISDDNDELEKQLCLAEAKINAKYHQFGFDMSSMIVEQNDRSSIPNHYKTFIS